MREAECVVRAIELLERGGLLKERAEHAVTTLATHERSECVVRGALENQRV